MKFITMMYLIFFGTNAFGYQLQFEGRMIPQFKHVEVSDQNSTVGFELASARLGAHLEDERLGINLFIMPELTDQGSLRDAWVEFSLSSESSLRFGQQTVPFQWQRSISSSRQFFTDRSLIGDYHGLNSGRDLGLNFIYKKQRRTLQAGIFNGKGVNERVDGNQGMMASFRVTQSLMGDLPSEESSLSQDRQWSLAMGLQSASKNISRDWYTSHKVEGSRAHFTSAVVDSRFSLAGFSVIGELLYRHVNTQGQGHYDDWGYHLGLGLFLIPDRYEFVARHGQSRAKVEQENKKLAETSLGVNVFHRQYSWRSVLSLSNFRYSDSANQQKILYSQIILF